MKTAIAVLLFAIGFADDVPARVKVELSPKEVAWVGQRVTLAITLFTPDLFAGAPTFALPTVPGAVVLPPVGSPVIGSETIGDVTFTTQRHEFRVYAQRAGVVRIPEFAIRFESNAGFGQPIIERHVTSEAVSFTAKTPPGAVELRTIIAAHDLRVTDGWQPEPKAPVVGDAFIRTVTVTGDDVPGMVFPAFRLDEVDGLAAYPKEPVTNDQTERGALTGQRIETITYVCEAEGTATVPDRTLTWFDLDANALKTVNVPGRTFTIARAANSGSTSDSDAPAPNARSGEWQDFVMIGFVLVLCGILAALAWRPCVRFYEKRSESERAYFARLRRACQSDDPHAVYVALLLWLDRLGPMCLDEFARPNEDQKLSSMIAQLSDRVYACRGVNSAGWFGRPLFDRIALRRRVLLVAMTRRNADALPPLNPVA
jgi:hypothetical protein